MIFRREKDYPVRRLTEWNLIERRPRGRPKIKWKQRVENDMKAMRVKDCRRIIKDSKMEENS